EQSQVAKASEPIEIIDLRAWRSFAQLQSEITGEGIILAPPPLARRLLLWIDPERCVGPVLFRTSDRQRWVLDRPEAHQDAGRIPVWRVASSNITPLRIEGDRLFLSPRQTFGPSAGVQNWTSDVGVTRGILTRIRRMDAGVAKALDVTDTVFRSYLDQI